MDLAFIPAGLDTTELIKISTGVRCEPNEFQLKFAAEEKVSP
jgi:hypothetical protein